MTTEIDVIKAVAKLTCPHCDGTGGELLSICCGAPEFCDVEGMCGSCRDWTGFSRCEECNETGLRCPTLSRECEDADCDGSNHLEVAGRAHGRISDVTLEKAMAEARKLGNTILYSNFDDDGWTLLIDFHPDHRDTSRGTSDTPLEATCIALLASV